MKWKRMVESCEPFAASMPSISRPSGTRGRALIEMLMALSTTGAGGRADRESERTNATGLAGSDKNAHDCVLLRAGMGADARRKGRRAHIADWQAWKEENGSHA